MSALYQILVTLFLFLLAVTAGLAVARYLRPDLELVKKVLTIVKGWWLILAVMAAAAMSGKWGIWGLFLILSLYGVTEYLRVSSFSALKNRGIKLFCWTGTTIFYFLLLHPRVELALMFALVFQLFFVGILLIINRDNHKIPLAIAVGVGVMTLVVALGSVTKLVFIGERVWGTEDAAISALLILVIVTSFNDVFQFIGGKSFGKRKIVPHLSPNKTEAGFISGILGTSLLSAILFNYLLDTGPLPAALIGVAVGVAGILGDLFMSSVKRSVGVKDFSDLIPGHGGLLDRIDSLIFTAPTFLLALLLVLEMRT